MNEQNNKLELLKKRCKTSTKVITVLQVIAVIGIVGALIGAISCFTLKDTINQAMAEQIASGKATVENFEFGTGILNFKMNYEKAFESGNYADPLAINCVMAAIITGISLFLLTAFKKIFKNLINEENPFSDSILNNLKICSIVIIVVLGAFVGVGPAVVIGLLLWCIESVLEYGKVLQTEVDEML